MTTFPIQKLDWCNCDSTIGLIIELYNNNFPNSINNRVSKTLLKTA